METTMRALVKRESISYIVHEPGIDGFDVGFEMSGNAAAFNDSN